LRCGGSQGQGNQCQWNGEQCPEEKSLHALIMTKVPAGLAPNKPADARVH
jgi:hypothetical protein